MRGLASTAENLFSALASIRREIGSRLSPQLAPGVAWPLCMRMFSSKPELELACT